MSRRVQQNRIGEETVHACLFEMAYPQSSSRSGLQTRRMLEVHSRYGENTRGRWSRGIADESIGARTVSSAATLTEGNMELKQFVTTLVDMIWEREQGTHRSIDTAALGYVQDAVVAELEYRRRMRELDRRIADLAGPVVAVSES